MRSSIVLAAAAAVLSGLPAPGQSPRDLTGYLPADTPVVLDLHDAAGLVREGLALLRPLPEGLPPAARLFLDGLPLLTKAVTGLDLTDLLQVVAPGQAALALFPAEGRPFPVFLARVTEDGEVHRVLRRLRTAGGGPRPIHARIDRGVLTVSDTGEHLQTAVGFRGGGRPTLLSKPGYMRQRAALVPGSIRFYVDVAGLRARRGPGAASLWDQLDAGARLLVGPRVRVLDLCSRIDGRLEVTAAGLRLSGRADADLGGDRRGVGRLAATGAKVRRIPAGGPSHLACLALDRDLGEFLGHPDAWLGDDGATGVKSFLSVADQVLGGASLLEDLFPSVRFPVSLFVTDTTPPDNVDRPRLSLPAFSLVFPLEADGGGDPGRRAQRLLTRAMHSLATIANVNRARSRNTPLSVRNGHRDGYRFAAVGFPDWDGPGAPPLERGFSPTLLFAHGHGIISSTTDGAVRMARSLASGETREVCGDLLLLDGAAVAGFIERNRSVLAIDRVLRQGGTRRAAERFVDALRAAASALRVTAAVEPGDGGTGFRIEVRRSR